METSTPADSPPDPATRTSGKAALVPRPDWNLAPGAIFTASAARSGVALVDGADGY